ncbi:MAG: hypothetical protein IJ059_00050 [Prevotella sp.]|nr:hypothetical protein [Prevotella sp.]
MRMGKMTIEWTKRLKARLFAYLLPLTAGIVMSCTQDGYDKGDSEYSNMRGDFVEAQIGNNKKIVSITTDDGDFFELAQPFSAQWIATPDTVYRCMLYYNKVRDSRGRYIAQVLSVGEIPCPKVVTLAELDSDMKTDPVKFESAWLSKTGRYINLSFSLMTGSADDEKAIHSLRVVQDTITTNQDGTRTSHLRLYHDQGGVPEYYSAQAYASIITSQIPADSASITINTYTGVVEKAFPLRNNR